MTSIRFLQFLPLLLLLLLQQQVYSEQAEPVLRAAGTVIEMGYCFGVDYIVVYRCAPEGDQLLGNSSDDSAPVTPPADLQGRIHINKQEDLLGLQITHLTHQDSGIYRRECWREQALVSQHRQQLTVCGKEVDNKEVTVEEDGGAELLCINSSVVSEGTSVRWYYEMHPLYQLTLFLDSSVSLDPLVEELQDVEVRDGGVLLLLDKSTVKNNQHFFCLVSKGKKCLSFQNMHLPEHSEYMNIYASQGDRLVLKCPSDGDNQLWETPLGRINASSVRMHISFLDKSEDFSLVIPAFSDEYSGYYSCMSSLVEVQYSLVLCPRKESQQTVGFEGGNILLDCDVGEDDFQRVQWHRREPSGESKLILDSNDNTVPILEDLRGRLSENGSALTISHLQVKDGGEYWCVVLGGSGFLEDNDDYTDDYDEENAGEDEYWEDTESCVFKQETTLTVIKKIRGVDPVVLKPVTGNPETDSAAADLSAAPNVTAYAVGAGLVGLLVVAVIVAVIVIKRRPKAKQRDAASRSGLNSTKEPGCTEMLNQANDEYDA